MTGSGISGTRQWTPWRAVVAFGLVSLSADMVYEGMRAVAGPFLGSLGASALTVGLVTGAGEAVALVLRLFTGPWADQRHLHWPLTVIGYGLTAVCVPLLAVTPFLGGAGLAVAAGLILLERTGKAVRSPSKSALLAQMTVQTGRGRGFGVHKALDQIGSFSGPLLLAGLLALTGRYWPGFALLAIPGLASMLLLAQLRRHFSSLADPEAEVEEVGQAPATTRLRDALVGTGLPGSFYLFSLAVALSTAGLMTYGVISFRFVQEGVLSAAAVPLVYALAMAAGAVAALAAGDAFDRWGAGTLMAVPVLVAAVPFAVFAGHVGVVLLGLVVWGTATGLQDSTVKAYVADLVPQSRRATAYGVFAALQGLGALAGGAVAGALLTDHRALLSFLIFGVQVIALGLLGWTIRRAVTRVGVGA